jgi:hypothetical protein
MPSQPAKRIVFHRQPSRAQSVAYRLAPPPALYRSCAAALSLRRDSPLPLGQGGRTAAAELALGPKVIMAPKVALLALLVTVVAVRAQTAVVAPASSPSSGRCELPDLSGPGYGPDGPDVNKDRGTGVDHRQLRKEVRDLQRELDSYTRWHDSVVGCFWNPARPVWYQVDWNCLLGAVVKPVGADAKASTFAGYGSSWIAENAQCRFERPSRRVPAGLALPPSLFCNRSDGLSVAFHAHRSAYFASDYYRKSTDDSNVCGSTRRPLVAAAEPDVFRSCCQTLVLRRENRVRPHVFLLDTRLPLRLTGTKCSGLFVVKDCRRRQGWSHT